MAGLWDVLGGAIGGGLAYLGAREDQKAARQAAELQAATVNQAADRAIAAGEPYGVGSLGGTASFDPESKTSLLKSTLRTPFSLQYFFIFVLVCAIIILLNLIT